MRDQLGTIIAVTTSIAKDPASVQSGIIPAGSQWHRQVQRTHALARYKERYSAVLSYGHYHMLCDAIWAYVHGIGSSDVTPVPGNTSRYMVVIESIVAIGVWDRRTMQIATFLPLASDIHKVEC